MKIAFRVLILILIIVLIGYAFLNKNFIAGIYHNNQSILKISEKMNYEALSENIEALRFLPLAPELHINLGDLYILNKDFERAEKEFGTASRLALLNLEMKFDAYFNAGVAASQLKKVDPALAFYQESLEVKPDSIEAKTNIELLVQQQGGKGDGAGDPDSSKDDKKDDKGKQGNRNDPNQKVQNEPPKNQPQPYKGKEISKENVNKILDELKQQEQNVRAKFENRNVHNSKNEKDW